MPITEASREGRWPYRPDSYYVERIKSRCVVTPEGCWEWQGSKNYLGYGQTTIRNVRWMVHRFTYTVANGPIPAGMYACHHCDNPSCCNPNHIWIGDHTANQRDMVAKGRHAKGKKTECYRGHPLSGDNVREYADGHRSCVACQRIRQRIKAGWTLEQAENLEVTPHGHRPVNGKFKRRSSSAGGGE